MKKQALTAIVALLGLSSFAQVGNGNSESVTLNVKLNPIQTLVINPTQKTVDLNYVSKGDYANGVTNSNDNHLTVYSTGGFQVKVKTSTATLDNIVAGTTTGGAINAKSIKVTPSAGTNGLTNATYSEKSLSNEDQTIVSSTIGGVDKNISVAYKGAGAETYLNNYVAGQNPTVYSTQVTYTIIAQ